MDSFATRAPGLFGKGRRLAKGALLVAAGFARGQRWVDIGSGQRFLLKDVNKLSRRQVQRLLQGYT